MSDKPNSVTLKVCPISEEWALLSHGQWEHHSQQGHEIAESQP